MQEDNDELSNRFGKIGLTTNLTKDNEENMGVCIINASNLINFIMNLSSCIYRLYKVVGGHWLECAEGQALQRPAGELADSAGRD
jgi:hypothetical protein